MLPSAEQSKQHSTHLTQNLHQRVGQGKISVLAVKTCGFAQISAPSCSPYAVDVLIYITGQIIVDDVSDIGDVQTTGSNVGGNQHGCFTQFKISQSFLPLSLKSISVQNQQRELRLLDCHHTQNKGCNNDNAVTIQWSGEKNHISLSLNPPQLNFSSGFATDPLPFQHFLQIPQAMFGLF